MPRAVYKRKRYIPPSPKRPIDKILKNVTVSASSTNRQVQLMQSSFPGTVVGLRWEGAITNLLEVTTNSLNQVMWAIVLKPDNTDLSDLAFGGSNAAGNSYQPEQNVLATGVVSTTFSDANIPVCGSTKTMRKLKAGDSIWFLAQSVFSTNNFSLSLQVTFFYKT